MNIILKTLFDIFEGVKPIFEGGNTPITWPIPSFLSPPLSLSHYLLHNLHQREVWPHRLSGCLEYLHVLLQSLITITRAICTRNLGTRKSIFLPTHTQKKRKTCIEAIHAYSVMKYSCTLSSQRCRNTCMTRAVCRSFGRGAAASSDRGSTGRQCLKITLNPLLSGHPGTRDCVSQICP